MEQTKFIYSDASESDNYYAQKTSRSAGNRRKNSLNAEEREKKTSQCW